MTTKFYLMLATAAMATSAAAYAMANTPAGAGTPIAAAVEGAVVANPALAIQPTDRILGNPMAPHTLIEYASMTCSHCARFHTEFLPAIQKEYIDTGKLKLVQRDLPWDNMALGIAKVARCAEPNQYYTLVGAFFKTQEQWMKTSDPMGEIKKISRLVGMTPEKTEACINDGPLQEQLLATKKVALEVLKVQGTPTFYLNGKQIELTKFEDVKAAVDAVAK
ncbi:MAG: DsbA family protein [Alphaproteobacteria bacterium]